MMRQLFSLRIHKNESLFKHFKSVTLPTACCALFLLLLLTAFALSPFSPIYRFAIESQPNRYVMGVPQTKLVTADMLNYLWLNEPLNKNIALSTQAVRHMADVKQLFTAGELVLVLLGVCTFFILRLKNKLQRLHLLIWSTASAIATIVLCALLFLLGFEKVFVLFHKIMFANDLWLFPANDSLILFFPEYFFAMITTQLFVWLFTSLCVVLLFLVHKERRERLSSSKPAQHI